MSPKELFLPLDREDMNRRGWDECDFVLISGDAYVDHSSFGAALVGRWLESLGWRVGIIPQPDWRTPESLRVLGRPRLAFLVTAGNMDSMVNGFSASRHRRREDLYSPGGKTGCRPDRASLVYGALARRAYKGVPVILGGVEASLRRLTHYDYWSDSFRRSLLVDSKADLLVYGMGELPLEELARRLDRGEPVNTIRDIPGTLWRTAHREDLPPQTHILPSFDEIRENPQLFSGHYMEREVEADACRGRPLAESAAGQWVVQNPPARPLTAAELDRVYELPYRRRWHPRYDAQGGVPAFREVKFSLVSSRGCLGSCSFCSLNFHQGRIIQARSHESLLQEARNLIDDPDFKGYIHDVGGPTANFRIRACAGQETRGACPRRFCLFPDPCAQLEVDHSDYLALLRKLRALPGVKKVFIRSGIRYDYLLADKDESFFEELCAHHISGQLKVAPEHISPGVLKLMRKPAPSVYRRFARRFQEINQRLGMKQYLVPYFVSSHPGSTLEDALTLALYLKETGFIPDQVQDFYPTPGTRATCMYVTGRIPESGEEIFVARGAGQRGLQRALLQFQKPENRHLVRKALEQLGRTDLLGPGGLLSSSGKSPGRGRRGSKKRNRVKNRAQRD